MSTQDKVKINKLPTGVPGLDEIVGGGLPEFSFNIIAGAPVVGRRHWHTGSCLPMRPRNVLLSIPLSSVSPHVSPLLGRQQ